MLEFYVAMPGVVFKENESFDLAMRRFKRTIERSNRMGEIRSRFYYEKPTSRRKRKKLAAVKRQYRLLRLQRMLLRAR